MIKGDRRTGRRQVLTNAATGQSSFIKPVDRIGDKSFTGPYGSYPDQHIYPLAIPSCAAGGKVFVGQRREGFVVNLAETFDLVNDNPLGARDSRTNNLADKNVTTLALDLPAGCLTRPDQPILGVRPARPTRLTRLTCPTFLTFLTFLTCPTFLTFLTCPTFPTFLRYPVARGCR